MCSGCRAAEPPGDPRRARRGRWASNLSGSRAKLPWPWAWREPYRALAASCLGRGEAGRISYQTNHKASHREHVSRGASRAVGAVLRAVQGAVLGAVLSAVQGAEQGEVRSAVLWAGPGQAERADRARVKERVSGDRQAGGGNIFTHSPHIHRRSGKIIQKRASTEKKITGRLREESVEDNDDVMKK